MEYNDVGAKAAELLRSIEQQAHRAGATISVKIGKIVVKNKTVIRSGGGRSAGRKRVSQGVDEGGADPGRSTANYVSDAPGRADSMCPEPTLMQLLHWIIKCLVLKGLSHLIPQVPTYSRYLNPCVQLHWRFEDSFA
jgi:hypothetical protein